MTPLPSPPSTASRRRLPHPQGVAFPLGMGGGTEELGCLGEIELFALGPWVSLQGLCSQT